MAMICIGVKIATGLLNGMEKVKKLLKAKHIPIEKNKNLTPMTPNHNEELREKIIEANDELGKIKIGTYITGNGLSNALVVGFYHFEPSATDSVFDLLIMRSGSQEVERIDFSDGYSFYNDIQLADVLRAINKSNLNHSVAISDSGEFWEFGSLHKRPTDIYWNLAADLDGQTDKVKEFLWKIICSPK